MNIRREARRMSCPETSDNSPESGNRTVIHISLKRSGSVAAADLRWWSVNFREAIYAD